MADFNVRADSVDVEQIMRQIRSRIREKRGADYTEAELQQLANVKLEKFLDPRGVRSDLVEQFRRHRIVSPEPPKFEFEDTTLYDTHRGALRFMRKLLNPILKLFINPNPLIQAMHVQAQVNDEFHKRFRQREEMDPLFYQVIHNLVLETTRLGIEVQNLKMRVESLSSRMDFDERRARSLEGAVQYKKPANTGTTGTTGSTGTRGASTSQPPAAASGGGAVVATSSGAGSVPQSSSPTVAGSPDAATTPGGGEKRRRRRRRRRRPGQTMAETGGAGAGANGGYDAARNNTGSEGDEGDAGDVEGNDDDVADGGTDEQ